MTKKILLVIASTRPSRVGGHYASWFADRVRSDDRFEVEIADLREMNLPMMNEERHPRFGDYRLEHTKAWAATVRSADAVVFVMPEYNYAFTAPLKNAIDYLFAEWNAKPIGFVSYGGASGGLRAVNSLAPVMFALNMKAVHPLVAVPFAQQYVKDGALELPDSFGETADGLLDALDKAISPIEDHSQA